VRIVARKGSGNLHEFAPRVGTTFPFQGSTGTSEQPNSYSVDRSLRLGAGTWSVLVQGRIVSNTAGSMGLWDWHLEVDIFR
jgi:hypothetical protein